MDPNRQTISVSLKPKPDDPDQILGCDIEVDQYELNQLLTNKGQEEGVLARNEVILCIGVENNLTEKEPHVVFKSIIGVLNEEPSVN